MKVLLTGGAGYLGSVLVPKLIVRGHQVRILDVGYFGVGHLQRLSVELVRDDVRRLVSEPAFADRLLDGVDSIVHLSAISNDPSADLNPDLTYEVNVDATAALARAAKERGQRFVFSSSCSVYGAADGELDELGMVNPLTTYAVSKLAAERILTELADDAWRPVILRNGTLFGLSPRMRFDLVANIFAMHCALYGEVSIFGNGQQWRPFLHVNDCARAFVHFLEQPRLEHLVYNVAYQNLRVVDLIGAFQDLNPNLRVNYTELADVDERNYRVSTQRMQSAGFTPRTSLHVGVSDMLDAIVCGRVPDPEAIYYRNAKWLKELSQIGLKNHRELLGIMETFGEMRQAPRPHLLAA